MGTHQYWPDGRERKGNTWARAFIVVLVEWNG